MHASYIFCVAENILKFYFTGQQIKEEKWWPLQLRPFSSPTLSTDKKHPSFYEVL